MNTKLNTRLALEPIPGHWMFAGFLTAHLVTQWLGNLFYFEPESVATIWPGAGLLLAVLMLSTYRQWPIVIAATLTSGIIADIVILDRGWQLFLFFASAELVDGLLGALLLRRFIGMRIDMGRLNDVIGLVVLAGIGATAVGGCIGAAGVVAAWPEASYWAVWQLWWFSDALGVLAVTPPILAFQGISRRKIFTDDSTVIELVALMVSLFVIGQWVLGTSPGPAHTLFDFPYLVVPLAIWAALRFKAFIAALSVSIITLQAVVNGNLGLGPFIAYSDNVYQQVLALQGYIGILVAGVILLSAVVTQQHRAQRELLRATETKLAAMESIHERYWLYDKDLCLEAWNVRPDGKTELSDLERVGQPILEDLEYWAEKGLHGPGDPKQVAQKLYQQYQDGSIPRFGRYTTDDGRAIEMRRFRTPDGGYIYTEEDVTDRLALERTAAENEALFKAFLANTPSYITIKNLEGRYTHASNEVYHLYNLDESEVIGHFPSDFLSASVIQDITAGDKSVLANNETWTSEVEAETPEGVKIMLTVRFPIRDAAGQINAIGVTATDITELKQAEFALTDSEQRYRRLFETAPVAIWEQDWSGIKRTIDRLRADGVKDVIEHMRSHPEIIDRIKDPITLVAVNSEGLRLYGAADLNSFNAAMHDQPWSKQHLQLLNRAAGFLAGERRVVIEAEGTRIDGTRFPIRLITEIASDDLENWSRVYTSEQDITDEVRATARLAAYQDELRQLAGKISLAEESERRRISSELHDGTVQNLVLARMKLASLIKSLRSKKSTSTADAINELLERSLNETRSLIFELSPPVLYELGLEAAIVWLGDQFSQRTGINPDFKSDGQAATLSRELEIVLFHAMRELLINVAKHANAEHVAIRWLRHNDRLELIVEDDGIGFDIPDVGSRSAADGGFGLFSLRERLRLLGAQLIINSSESGTRISVTAPV